MRGNFPSLVALAEEIERQEKVKDDLIVPASKLHMSSAESIDISGRTPLSITQHAHGQLATKLGIPRKYYEKIAEVPGLREKNVNALIQHDGRQHLVRTLDGRARAFLSDKFKPIDNYLMLSAVMPIFREHQDLEVKSVSLTETRMYLQVVFPQLQVEVARGDVVQSGLVMRNSEVGSGSYEIEQLIWRLVCTNGMIGQSMLRKYHVGRRVGESEEDYNIFRADTIQAEIESMRLRTRDIVAHTLTESYFEDQVAKMRMAREDRIEQPNDVIKNVTKRFNLSEDQGSEMLITMARESEINRYGLANSITALAHSIENRDCQYEVEKIGNEIIELSPKDWKVLAA